MTTTAVRSSGFFAFWTIASWSNPVRLKLGFEAAGFPGEEPEPLKPAVALREAMLEHFHSTRTMVRPLADEKGFAAVEEVRGKEANSYVTKFTVRMSDDETNMLFSPAPPEGASDLIALYQKRRNSVPGKTVGSSLVRIANKLNGVAIRKTGGIYWIHQNHADQWGLVQKAVQDAAMTGTSEVYMATMKVDAEGMRVVRDSIEREILAESALLFQEVTSGDIGERALKTRMEQVYLLQAKVKEYEEIVGQSLAHLTSALENVTNAAGVGEFRATIQSAEAA